MNPVDIGHRVLVLGLVGVSLYYGSFTFSTMGAMANHHIQRGRGGGGSSNGPVPSEPAAKV